MSFSRFRYLLSVLLAAIALAAATSAIAMATTTSGNTATLRLSVKAKRALARQHAVVRALGPATRHKSRYALPVSSGTWNFLSATGTLNLKGVLAIVVRKHSLKINSVTFTRPSSGNGRLTAKLAGHRVRLFSITGRARVTRSATSETLSGMTAKLTKAGATKFEHALHGGAFHAGQSFGSFTVTVGTSPIAGSKSGAPAVTGAPSAGAGVQFLPAFRSLLASAGLSAVPLVPASNGLPAPAGTSPVPGGDGTALTLPVNGSPASMSYDNGVLTGTIPLSGGLQLGNGQISVSLTNPQLTLGTGTEGSSLSFQVNGGPRVKLFDLDTSQLEQAALPNGTLDLTGLLASLSSEGAASLNAALGHNLFTTAQPVGGLTVIVPAPPQG